MKCQGTLGVTNQTMANSNLKGPGLNPSSALFLTQPLVALLLSSLFASLPPLGSLTPLYTSLAATISPLRPWPLAALLPFRRTNSCRIVLLRGLLQVIFTFRRRRQSRLERNNKPAVFLGSIRDNLFSLSMLGDRTKIIISYLPFLK